MQNERRQDTQDIGLVTLVILTAIYLVLLYTFAGWLLPAR